MTELNKDDDIAGNKLTSEQRQMIYTKFLASLGTAQTIKKSPSSDIDLTLQVLYHSIFSPEKLTEERSDDESMAIGKSDEFPGRLGELKQDLKLSVKDVPNIEDFVTACRTAIERTDLKAAVFEGSQEALEYLAQKGIVIFWTAGDVGTDGLGPQVWKIARSGLSGLREKIAGGDKRKGRDVIRLSASENKMETLKTILEKLKDGGITNVVIVDDQLGGERQYLYDGAQMAEEIGLNTIPVWVNQGRYKDELPVRLRPEDKYLSITEFKAGYNSISGIGELVEKLQTIDKDLFAGNSQSSIATIVDVDGTLLSDGKRQKIQSDSVCNFIEQRYM